VAEVVVRAVCAVIDRTRKVGPGGADCSVRSAPAKIRHLRQNGSVQDGRVIGMQGVDAALQDA
jgi:hypothetical protein